MLRKFDAATIISLTKWRDFLHHLGFQNGQEREVETIDDVIPRGGLHAGEVLHPFMNINLPQHLFVILSQ